jgi:hypothetical protein
VLPIFLLSMPHPINHMKLGFILNYSFYILIVDIIDFLSNI